jgi:hypothetical protein
MCNWNIWYMIYDNDMWLINNDWYPTHRYLDQIKKFKIWYLTYIYDFLKIILISDIQKNS